MGIYYREHSRYIVKYNNDQYNDLYSILNKTIHYVYNDVNKWKYIEDNDDLIEFFEDEEFEDFAEGREVDDDYLHSLLSIDGDFIREHGDGTHLEINEDYLFEELFNYDNNIMIIKDYRYATDYDVNACFNTRELFYMRNGIIDSIYLESEEILTNFDKLVESSNLKLFSSNSFEDINIDEEIKNIYPRNIPKFFDKYKDRLSEENIIDLVKLDIHLLEELDEKLVNRVKNKKNILIEVVKNCDFYTLKFLEEDLIDSIVNDKDILISFLNNNDGYWEIEKVHNIDELTDLDEIAHEEYIMKDNMFEYKVLKKYGHDKDVMLLLIKNFGFSYENIDYELTKDRDVLIEAFKHYEKSLEYAPDDLRDDEELLKELLKINKKAYKYASDRLCEKYKPLREKKPKEFSKKRKKTTVNKEKVADGQLGLFETDEVIHIFENIISSKEEDFENNISLFKDK